MGTSFLFASVIDAIADLLATVNGSGGYTNTLTATDSIQYGDPGIDPVAPQVSVWITSVLVESTAQSAALGEYERTAMIELLALAKATEDTPLKRLDGITALVDDIVMAIEGSSAPGQRTLGGIAIDDIVVRSVDFSRSLHMENSARSARISVVVTWRCDAGSGV